MEPGVSFIEWFRQAAPYIHAHRGRNFVIQLSGDVVASDKMPQLLHDMALLNSLAVKLVIVFGARPQIDVLLKERNIAPEYHQSLRVTSEASLSSVRQAVGDIKIEIESLLSMGLPNSPMQQASIRVASGNYIAGQPAGIVNGVDLHLTGRVRKIQSQHIQQRLDSGEIVLIPPLGYSLTGQVFNLSSLAVAAELAVAIKADKLIMISNSPVLLDENNDVIRQVTCEQAQAAIKQSRRQGADEYPDTAIVQGLYACESGVSRVHYLDNHIDGGLLLELFSRDGVGTLLSHLPFDTVHSASVDDIGGILQLIQPLEEQGVLVKRSSEKIEVDVDDYIVLKRDGAVIGCAALHLYADDNVLELACLAVHPDYRNQHYGGTLYQYVEQLAKAQGVTDIIVLTTQTEHWFISKGFVELDIAELPLEKQEYYNYQRNSKALKKNLR